MGLGACDDSLCLPRRPTLSVTMRMANVQTVGVRQQNIVLSFPGSTNNKSFSIAEHVELPEHVQSVRVR